VITMNDSRCGSTFILLWFIWRVYICECSRCLFGFDKLSWFGLVGSLIQGYIVLILFVHVIYRALYCIVSRSTRIFDG
jgi:hypothetical protein